MYFLRSRRLMSALSVVSFLCMNGCATDLSKPVSGNALQPAKLFASLPDTCPTPDAFAVAPDGSMTLSCVNYANNAPGILLSLSAKGEVTELGPIPGFKARPMGLAYAPDGSLFVANNAGADQGNLLRLTILDKTITHVDIVASGLSSPNGLRYHNGMLFLSQLLLPKAGTAKISSGIYRFSEHDRNIAVAGDLSSSHLIFSTQTQNPERQYGLDGLVFDSKGNLYVGDFGDAIIYQLKLKSDGTLANSKIFAQLPNSAGIDGLAIDKQDNLYLAGFLRNQIYKVTSAATVSLLAEYPDNDGSNGAIDQPADLIVWGKKLLISNFDLMKGPGIVNSTHGKPYTISHIDL